MDNKELHKEAVVENSKWIDKVLMSGFLVSLSIVILKLFYKETIKWMDVEFKLANSWIIFLLLTVAHLYTTILLTKSIKKLWDKFTFDDRSFVYTKIISTGGIFSRGLTARTEVYDDWEFKVKYKMTYEDPSAWVALVTAVLMFIAIIPFPISKFSILDILIASLIINANWIIGTNWIVALSELSLDTDHSTYFEKASFGGVGMKVMSSGGDAFRRIPYLIFPLWFLLNSFVRVMVSPLLFIFKLIFQVIYKVRKHNRVDGL